MLYYVHVVFWAEVCLNSTLAPTLTFRRNPIIVVIRYKFKRLSFNFQSVITGNNAGKE